MKDEEPLTHDSFPSEESQPIPEDDSLVLEGKQHEEEPEPSDDSLGGELDQLDYAFHGGDVFMEDFEDLSALERVPPTDMHSSLKGEASTHQTSLSRHPEEEGPHELHFDDLSGFDDFNPNQIDPFSSAKSRSSFNLYPSVSPETSGVSLHTESHEVEGSEISSAYERVTPIMTPALRADERDEFAEDAARPHMWSITPNHISAQSSHTEHTYDISNSEEYSSDWINQSRDLDEPNLSGIKQTERSHSPNVDSFVHKVHQEERPTLPGDSSSQVADQVKQALSSREAERNSDKQPEDLTHSVSVQPENISLEDIRSKLETLPPLNLLEGEDLAQLQALFQRFIRLKRECGQSVKVNRFPSFVKQLRSARERYIEQNGWSALRFRVYRKGNRVVVKAKPVKI